MARTRVKSRRNRRPSKARTRRVSKRRTRRISKRRMRRTSKRGRRFQRGGMEKIFNPSTDAFTLTPEQKEMRTTIRPRLEPGPDQDSLRSMDYSIYSEDDETGAIRKLLPAISVKLFNDPSADHTKRYHRLLELRAKAYFDEIVNVIEDKIKVLQGQFDDFVHEGPKPKAIISL